MKKWVIIAVIFLIVAVTVWYFAYSKKDQDRLISTERKMKRSPDESPLKVVKSSKVNTIGGPRAGSKPGSN